MTWHNIYNRDNKSIYLRETHSILNISYESIHTRCWNKLMKYIEQRCLWKALGKPYRNAGYRIRWQFWFCANEVSWEAEDCERLAPEQGEENFQMFLLNS